MADDVTIRIGAVGAREAAGELKMLSGSLTGLGRSAALAAGPLKTVGSTTSRSVGQGLNVIGQGARYAGLGLAGLGAYAVKSGIQFNASMEQNQIAFTQFLGSASAARSELALLYHTASVTPFQVGDVTTAARKLLAFNFSLKQTNGWLTTIGDTIAGAGGGPEQIQQMVTAIGQIRAKGQLQGGELLQLENLGVVDTGALAKKLGVTNQQLHSGNEYIPATKALAALQSQLDKTFGGQAAKQAQSFNGQISTLKDNLNMTLGAATLPLFQSLEKKVLPALGATTTEIQKISKRKDIDFGEKIKLDRAVVKQKLGPLWDEAKRGLEQAHIGDKIGEAIDAAAPKVADAAGKLGLKVAGGFVSAFLHAGPWGQLATGLWLGSKLGLGKAALQLGQNLAGGGKGGLAGAIGGRGATPANPMWVAVVNGGIGKGGVPVPVPGGGAPGKGKSRGGGILSTGAKALGAAAGYEALHSLAMSVPALSQYSGKKGFGELARDLGLSGGGAKPRSTGYGHARGGQGPLVQANVHVQIDGKDVGHHVVTTLGKDITRTVRRIAEDEKARGR